MFLEVDTAVKNGVLKRALSIYARILYESCKGNMRLLEANADYQTAMRMIKDMQWAESAVIDELAWHALDKLQKEWRNN